MHCDENSFCFALPSFERLAVSGMNVSPNTQMPSEPGDQQHDPKHDGDPIYGRPNGEVPLVLPESPDGDEEMAKVADEEGEEEGGADALLESGVVLEVFAYGAEGEVVEEAEERADVRELEGRHDRRDRQGFGRRGA